MAIEDDEILGPILTHVEDLFVAKTQGRGGKGGGKAKQKAEAAPTPAKSTASAKKQKLTAENVAELSDDTRSIGSKKCLDTGPLGDPE